MATLLKRGNAKLSKAIANFSIPAGKEVCGIECKGCYAIKIQKRYKNVAEAWQRNLKDSLKPDFEDRIVAEIKRLYNSKHSVRYIRIHTSGEFYSTEYIFKWANIAQRVYNEISEDIIFYAYSKKWKAFKEELSFLNVLPNVVVHDSLKDGLNYDIKSKIEARAKKTGGFICPDTVDKSVKCGETCTWCMQKGNESKPIYFVKH